MNFIPRGNFLTSIFGFTRLVCCNNLTNVGTVGNTPKITFFFIYTTQFGRFLFGIGTLYASFRLLWSLNWLQNCCQRFVNGCFASSKGCLLPFFLSKHEWVEHQQRCETGHVPNNLKTPPKTPMRQK